MTRDTGLHVSISNIASGFSQSTGRSSRLDKMEGGGDDIDGRQLHLVTPAVHSVPISKAAGFSVYLKLENLQVPGSFKIRGVGHRCKKAVKAGCKRIVCASGGNGGLAAAYAARMLGIPATIVLPESTPSFVADKLRDEKAEVKVVGKVWDNSNAFALKMAEDDPETEYIHPFDHPDVWEGHTSLIQEVSEQLPCRPDVIIVSVGGGGLLNGILRGLDKVGWSDVPCVAIETVGADCLNAALKAEKMVTLPDITSVAKCLGALTVCSDTFEKVKDRKNFHSVVLEDKQVIDACLKFADDHRMLVEPACGASLAAVYGDVIPQLQTQGKLGRVENALVIVCGGAGVSLKQLQTWKAEYGL